MMVHAKGFGLRPTPMAVDLGLRYATAYLLVQYGLALRAYTTIVHGLRPVHMYHLGVPYLGVCQDLCSRTWVHPCRVFTS